MNIIKTENGREVVYRNIPDCWHAAMWLKDNGNPKMGDGRTLCDMVLDCWYQAHDYRAVVENRAILIKSTNKELANV